MSDSSESAAGDDTAETPDEIRALRDVRWLTGLIWLGLLVALLVTSVYAVHAFTQGTIATRYFGIPFNGVLNNNPEDKAQTNALGGLCLSGLAGLAILGGWIAFVRATKAVIVALAEAPASRAAPVAEWLIVSEDSDGSGPTGARTLVSDVLVFVGAAWLVIIVTPAVLAAVQAYA